MVNTSIAELGWSLPYLSASQDRFVFDFIIEAGVNPQALCRNRIIEIGLGRGADVVMMIDDDMVITETTMLCLDTPDWDIVAPLQMMFRRKNPEKNQDHTAVYPCAFDFPNDRMTVCYPKKNETVVSVEAVGSGVMAVKRALLEDPRMLIEPGLSPPALFQDKYKANGERTRGLDIDFCRRAHALGYRVKCNFGAVVGHYKRVDLNLIEEYAKRHYLEGWEAGHAGAVSLDQVAAGPGDGEDGTARQPACGG